MDARRPDQVAADAAEAQASVRYLRQRTFAGVLDDANRPRSGNLAP